jgi:hypothetical protein
VDFAGLAVLHWAGPPELIPFMAGFVLNVSRTEGKGGPEG